MMKDGLKKLRPTLWRTCRTLANRTRLELFRYVLLNPGRPVAEIAAGLNIHPTLASKYLRELNSRGLLSITRHAANVFYSVGADPSMPQAGSLVGALTVVFKKDKAPTDMLYRKVTAFTHPRRVAIAKRLRQGSASFSDLRRQLGISTPALQRHLRKLASRGFLQSDTGRGIHAVIETGSPLEMVLLELAQNT